MQAERYETVIVGGGQAGLATGYPRRPCRNVALRHRTGDLLANDPFGFGSGVPP